MRSEAVHLTVMYFSVGDTISGGTSPKCSICRSIGGGRKRLCVPAGLRLRCLVVLAPLPSRPLMRESPSSTTTRPSASRTYSPIPEIPSTALVAAAISNLVTTSSTSRMLLATFTALRGDGTPEIALNPCRLFLGDSIGGTISLSTQVSAGASREVLRRGGGLEA